jgi:single-stranded DNA-binding protein
MVAGVNRWYGIGNMVADPELRQGDSSTRTTFAIAINKPGQDSEALFLDVICWDGDRSKLASQVADFGRKGRTVFIDGEIEIRRFEGDEGPRKMYRIKAYTVRFLDRRPDDDEEPRSKRRQDDEEPRRRSKAQQEEEPKRRETARDYDDLPF